MNQLDFVLWLQSFRLAQGTELAGELPMHEVNDQDERQDAAGDDADHPALILELVSKGPSSIETVLDFASPQLSLLPGLGTSPTGPGPANDATKSA
jgi:hypothetical protein